MTEESHFCFVIMPFSKSTSKHTEEYWTKWWLFIKDKIEEIPNFVVKRSEALRGDIVREIIRDLYSADVVIADLTDRNPNVYWELGVRQSFKHGSITIAETRKHVASDMGMKGVLRYWPYDAVKNEEFVKKLKDAIKDCIENPQSTDSHVLESITGRGSLYSIINEEEIRRKIVALYQEFQLNTDSINIMFDIYYENKELNEEGWMAYGFSCSCIEYLLTTRYLEESPGFYSGIANYFFGWIL